MVDYERLSSDFLRSADFACWQFKQLLAMADRLIEENDLGPDSRADVVSALIRLMEVVT